MALLSVIWRWYYLDHPPIRDIVRRTGLPRNTIRRYLWSDTIEPQFKVPARPSKRDAFADLVSLMVVSLPLRGHGAVITAASSR